ncbi:Similar to VPS50: Syndetin (Homo sapiens) [Cotesia congregata]|uniref:Similar to VPS50: Syndetin (Homo sapiens) n=1 Tax=Cotesia congregata TaxID=51543 RepID=A0A8J2HRF9_COTCN|nr:Similar to VPS50: Syndetin (Homo sapiens) [Cotesia congregata]
MLRLMEASEEFCGKKLEILQQSMKEQCSLYFAQYHASRLDELCIFLEHDGWELCPVKSTFTATQLQEFKSLESVLNDSELLGSTNTTNAKFDNTKDEDILATIGEKTVDYISEDSEDEINHDSILNYAFQRLYTKKKIKTRLAVPMVTNTTLNVLRVCGRYLQMSKLLTSIAVTVIQSMIQFFELYLYCINLFFTSDFNITSKSVYTSKLRSTLTRIEKNLIRDGTINMDDETLKVRRLNLSPVVDLHSDDNFFGLAERVVGVESLIFLGQQYDNLQSYLRRLISENSEKGFLDQFYTETVRSAVDLRKPVYMAVVSKYFKDTNIITLMNKVNWEIKDVMSQHSSYIDVLHHEIEAFARSLNNLTRIIPITTDVKFALWDNVAHLITNTTSETLLWQAVLLFNTSSIYSKLEIHYVENHNSNNYYYVHRFVAERN